MSSAANWTYIYTLTIWPVVVDDHSQVSYSTPYTLKGDWMQGGSIVADQNGNEIIPNSTYFFEAVDGSPLVPKPDDYIKRGDHRSTATPITVGAERIKYVGGWPAGAFGPNELPDWKIVT